MMARVRYFILLKYFLRNIQGELYVFLPFIIEEHCTTLSSKPALPAKFWLQTSVQAQSSNSFILAHRAFVIPVELIEETWEWSKNNKFETDLFRHPNTGCMTDDHGIR